MRDENYSPVAAIVIVAFLTVIVWGGLYGFYLFVRHGWNFLFG